MAAARAVPKQVLPLLQRMLSPEPGARPSAAEVHAALAASLAALTPLAQWASPLMGQTPPGGPSPGASSQLTARAEAHGAAGAAGAAGGAAAARGGGKLPMPASSSTGDGGVACGASSGASSADSSSYGSAGGAGGASGGGGGASRGASGGGSGEAAFAPMHPPPPVRRSPDDGYVRCLGWESLPFTAARLASAVTNTLNAMRVAYTADPRRHCVDVHLPPEPLPLLPSPPLGLASWPASTAAPPVSAAASTTAPPTAAPAPTAAASAAPATTTCDLHGVQQPPARSPSLPDALHVGLTIFADESAKETHHVDVRRRSGPHWQFQRFYIRFRELVHPPTHTPVSAVPSPPPPGPTRTPWPHPQSSLPHHPSTSAHTTTQTPSPSPTPSRLPSDRPLYPAR